MRRAAAESLAVSFAGPVGSAATFVVAAAFEAGSAICSEVVAAGACAALTDGRGLITGATFSGDFDVPLSAAACGATGALGMATATAGGDAAVPGEAAPDPPLACGGVAAPSAAATAVTLPDGVGTSNRMPATPPAASTTSPATARYGTAPTLRAAGAGRRSSADTAGEIIDSGSSSGLADKLVALPIAGRRNGSGASAGYSRGSARSGRGSRDRRMERLSGILPRICRLALLGAGSIGPAIDTATLGPE